MWRYNIALLLGITTSTHQFQMVKLPTHFSFVMCSYVYFMDHNSVLNIVHGHCFFELVGSIGMFRPVHVDVFGAFVIFLEMFYYY